MTNTSLLILEPPYLVARRHVGPLPSLGSVALLDATASRLRSSYVQSEMDNAPWCPLCLLASPDSGMRSTRRLARTCVVFGLRDEDASASILRAVSSRPRPTATDLTDWIVSRTRLPMLARTLVDLFSGPAIRDGEDRFLPPKVRQRLQQLGDWNGREWQQAAGLADLAADRTLLNRTLSAEDASSTDTRRLMIDLLGVSDREFHRRYGWEWVLEASLRRSGFFKRDTRRVSILRPDTGEWQNPELAPLLSA